MSRWVIDTSPLIFLAKLDRLDLLRRKADEILVPPAVLEEVRCHLDDAAQRIEEALLSWLRVQPLADRGVLDILLADLDAGEAEAIALARESDADWIVMDDFDGRRFAGRLGLAVVGTLGLLLSARLAGEIPSLQSEIDRLRAAGFRINNKLLEAALEASGESP